MAVETREASPHHSGHSLSALSLAALGVVYGDIGTSPLYTLKVVLGATGKHPAPDTVLGSVSLIVWTLIIITTVKYIILALRVDNEGEGGVLALMALLSRKPGRRLIFFIGMFGAALVYGDCALTPAISVLSAFEGVDVISPELDRLVLPGTVPIRRLVRRAATSDRRARSIPSDRSWRARSWCSRCSACAGSHGSGRAIGAQSGTGPALPVFRWWQRHAGARRRVPLRHRGGGALR